MSNVRRKNDEAMTRNDDTIRSDTAREDTVTDGAVPTDTVTGDTGTGDTGTGDTGTPGTMHDNTPRQDDEVSVPPPSSAATAPEMVEQAKREEPPTRKHNGKPTHYKRFRRAERIEHALLFISFTTLVVTGLPQLYSQTWVGSIAIFSMGGIEFVRILHRAAAVLLMLETIYHGGIVTYKVFVKRVRLTMMPGWQDVKDGFQALGYNFGIAKTPPRMGRYTFGEKVEYWAVIWGTVIMVITGFMLWNPIATTRFLPGQAIPAAKAAHGGEALLAILSIITWHIYHVHIKHFNRSIFTGRISRHEMEEEHPLELEAIEAGEQDPPVDPALLRRRRQIFYPVATVISLLLLLGLYWFVTFEQTAIVTISP